MLKVFCVIPTLHVIVALLFQSTGKSKAR